MSKRDPQVIDVVTLSEDGCGYSSDGKQAVLGSLAGEQVSALPHARKRKRHYFKVQEVLSASPERVEPACSVALNCGGCSFQHASRRTQLGLKEGYLKSQLEPLVPENWLEPLVGEEFFYRSKARLGVKFVEKKNRVLVGFREKQKPYITDTQVCPVLAAGLDEMIIPLQELVADLSVCRAVPQIEIAAGDDESAIVLRHLEPLNSDDVEKLKSFGHRFDVGIYLQPGGADTVHKIHPDTSGELLTYRLPDFDLDYEFHPLDFTQVNLEINRMMVASALNMLELNESDSVLDAFCGIGNFSLAMARGAGSVLGMEQSPLSIERAGRNAAVNDIRNASFLVADLHDESLEINGFTGFNKVLLDPPRSGAEALAKRLESHNIERVVYVSCNPETLARDAEILCSRGFNLRSAGIIDMFPHTTHVESIALFTGSIAG